jgi:hypothetical protein
MGAVTGTGPVTALDARVAALDAVGLDALDVAAALRTRIDRKYLVPVAVVDALVGAFDRRSCALEVHGTRAFRYDSLYFDTSDGESYRGAAHRRRHRFKVRTRLYRDAGTCMLEVKTRGGRGETVKQRQPHPRADRYDLPADARDFVDTCVGRPGIAGLLRPVLSTRYCRRTLLDTASSSRVTIDTDLEVAGFDGATHAFGPFAVLETKTAGGPLDHDRWLWAAGFRPLALSKFCVGTALVHPELPANRWTAALRQLRGR